MLSLHLADTSLCYSKMYLLLLTVIIFYVVCSAGALPPEALKTGGKFCVCPTSTSYGNQSNVSCHDCSTLEEYQSGRVGFTDDSILVFYPGVHNLSQPWTIAGLRNISLRALDSSGETAMIRCSSDNAGIEFSNVIGLNITGISVCNCGMNSTVDGNHSIKSALIFSGGENLTLQDLTVGQSIVAGISLVDITGLVLIEGSFFSNASISKENAHYESGNLIEYKNPSGRAAIEIRDTRFENNGYPQPHLACLLKDLRLSAGLSIVVKHGDLSICLSRVTLSGNDGCAGGNMALVLFDLYKLVNSTQISVHDSTIEGGTGNVGGGLFITSFNSDHDPGTTIVDGSDALLLPFLHIRNSTFIRNTAYFVGGGIYLKHLEAYHFSRPGVITIENCTFSDNRLSESKGNGGGLALHMTTFIVREYQYHGRPQLKVNVCSCTFTEHQNGDNKATKLGDAVIFVKTSPYFSLSDTNITNNNCTGVLALSSNVVLSSRVKISNNSAFVGGGMLLCAGAVLYLKQHTNLLITGNRAAQTGGGINIERECVINKPRCFFQYDSNVIAEDSALGPTITVKENSAVGAGDNIYGGSVGNCYLINVSHDNMDSYLTFKKIFDTSQNDYTNVNLTSLISSSPKQVCIVNSREIVNCSHWQAAIYAGQTLSLNMVIIGQLNGSVPGTVYAQVEDRWKEEVYIKNNEKVQIVPTKFPHRLSYKIYSKSESITANLYLRVAQDDSHHDKALVVSVTIKPCPLGYELTNGSTQSHCTCDNLRRFVHKAIKECLISRKAVIRYQPPVWIGVVQTKSARSMAVAKTCPHDYCCIKTIALDLSTLTISSTDQCYFNRSGVLCGGCVGGYSLLLGSSRCRKGCSSYSLFLLIFFAFAGIALVFFITFLNLTVSEGTMNGLIFYANIVQIYGFYVFQKNKIYIAPFLKIFIAWLNLDFGIETCFYSGMDGFSKALLQFAFPVYIWIISGAIVMLSSRFDTVAKICGRNSVKVLSTLILLSYSKILRAVMDALHFTPVSLFDNEDKTMVQHSLHWTVDGRIKYFEGKHVVIFVVGVAFSLVLIPFMLTLLFIQYIGLLSNWPCFGWVNTLKPFFDTFTGPFTDRGRFWIGFLLLIRILIMAVYSFNYMNSDFVVMAAVVLVCFVLLFISIILPRGLYKKHAINSLQNFFVANLGLLFLGLLSSIHYENDLVLKRVVVDISVSLSFIAFALIVVYHVLVKLRCGAILSRIRQRRFQVSFGSREADSLNSMSRQCSYGGTSEDRDREPLLASFDTE